ALARTVVTKDEAPNHKLGTLAGLFHATTSPDHRALHDARATVDVLHGLLGRLAPLGVTHLEDLATVADPVPHRRRRKATLADSLPTGPGVYQFLGPAREVLYVGKAVNLRRRVRSYFTAGEKRKRIGEMLDLTQDVRTIPCPTELEAAVRELRLIAELDPPYNRRSRKPHRRPWIRLTDEPFPRLSIVRSVPAGRSAEAIGPFSSRAAAQSALEALEEAFTVRRCSQRLPVVPSAEARACALAEMGRCGAPCTGAQSLEDYAEVAASVRAGLTSAAGPVVAALRARNGSLAGRPADEEAAAGRDRLRACVVSARRAPLLRAPRPSPPLVRARR